MEAIEINHLKTNLESNYLNHKSTFNTIIFKSS